MLAQERVRRMAQLKSLCPVLVFVHCMFSAAQGNYEPPVGVWPLTDESFGTDVTSSNNAAVLSSCVFQSGHPSLSTQSLALGGQTIIEISNNGGYFGVDFMVSALFYPTSSSGTLFHYVKNTGGLVFKVWYTASKVNVEVKNDQILLGSHSESYSIPTNSWSHIGFLREKNNGVIKLFVGIEKVIDIDDSFPDNTGLPTTGKLRIGKPFDSTTTGTFVGKVSCVQIFSDLISEGEMDSTVLNNCLRSAWITSVPTSPESTCASSETTTSEITTTIRTSTVPSTSSAEVSSTSTDAPKEDITTAAEMHGYFRLSKRNSRPITSGSFITVALTRSRQECGHVCILHNSCRSFSVLRLAGNEINCSLFDRHDSQLAYVENEMYYFRIGL